MDSTLQICSDGKISTKLEHTRPSLNAVAAGFTLRTVYVGIPHPIKSYSSAIPVSKEFGK